MNWTDFKIETETAYVNNSAETVHVHTMSSHATELCGKTLTFFSHNRNGFEQYYNLFEDFVNDLLSNVSHRVSYNLTLEESNDDEYVINMMVGTFFAIHGLDMDEYNYKHSDKESDLSEELTEQPRYITKTFKVQILSVLDKRIKVDAETEEEALQKVRDLASDGTLYNDNSFYYDDWADCEETYKIIEDEY